jgi:colicin import membrane protein
MGKKSLIKSTSKKKKATSKKKDEDKKSKVAEKAGATKAKVGQKVETKKKTAAQTVASSNDLILKDIIYRKFDREVPEELFKVEAVQRNYTSPPLISTTDKKEAERQKKLLFKKIDLISLPEKRKQTEAPEKPMETLEPMEEKKVRKADYKEIMARKFHQPSSPEVLAESSHKQVDKKKDVYTAPPWISTTDIKEGDQLKKLLFKKFDLTSFPKKSQESEEVIEQIEEKPTEEKKAIVPVEEKEIKKVDYKEIMNRKFYEPYPAPMLSGGIDLREKKKENYTAPPWILTDNPNEAAHIKEILFRQFEIPPAPVQPATPAVETKEPEAIIPEIVSEAEELTVGVKEEQIIPDSERIEAEKDEKDKISPKVTVSYDEPPPTKTEVSDPMDKMIKIVAAGVILIFVLLIGYSINNKRNYYIKPMEDGIEIWQGRFAPMGEELLARLTGVTPPENVKDVYTAEEVLPLAFVYYVDQADNLLNMKGIPDLKAIKHTLEKALSFALTKNEREIVHYRLNSMERHVLQYRANVAASRGTPEDIAIAIGFLTDSLKLNMDEQQRSMIQSRIEYLEESRDQLLGIESQPAEFQAEENDAVLEEPATEEPATEEPAVGQEDAEAVDVEESGKNQDADH